MRTAAVVFSLMAKCGIEVDTEAIWTWCVFLSHRLYSSSRTHALPPNPGRHRTWAEACLCRHSCVTLAQHIKELPPSSSPSCAPQHASAGPGDRPFVCFVGFVWILQSVSSGGRKCWALSLLLYCMLVRLKCWEARLTSAETRPSHSALLQHSRSCEQKWTINSLLCTDRPITGPQTINSLWTAIRGCWSLDKRWENALDSSPGHGVNVTERQQGDGRQQPPRISHQWLRQNRSHWDFIGSTG